MNKGQISNILRRLGLIYIVDWIRYYFYKAKNHSINKRFKNSYPDISLPPDYLIYESFQLNYDKYYFGGKKVAIWLKDHFEKHIELQELNILDWGCGPGRVIRHMPEIIGNGCHFYGTDYNSKSILWCKNHINNVTFSQNELQPELQYQDSSMDVIYGISIFTHLSEPMHFDWFNELYRILKKGGIMLLTTHGDNFKIKLDPNELESYTKGELIVRGQVKEGHRTYCAFQPPQFMRNLFHNVEILEHVITNPNSGSWLPQDIWIIRK